MTASAVPEVKESRDPTQLLGIIRGLAGQPCWKAALSYGEELTLHLGEHIPYNNPKLTGREKGAWILGTRGSRWRLSSADGPFASSDDSRELAMKALTTVEGAKVTAIFLFSQQLTLGFDNGCILNVLPDTSDGDDNLASWELFTPGHMLLSFGPGDVWSYVPSDRPM